MRARARIYACTHKTRTPVSASASISVSSYMQWKQLGRRALVREPVKCGPFPVRNPVVPSTTQTEYRSAALSAYDLCSFVVRLSLFTPTGGKMDEPVFVEHAPDSPSINHRCHAGPYTPQSHAASHGVCHATYKRVLLRGCAVA